jgi:hypothetical protein
MRLADRALDDCVGFRSVLPILATPHYPRPMPWTRRLAVICALGAFLTAGAGAALGTSSLDIYTDWADNGVVDGRYSTGDLRDALSRSRGDANYGSFADAVQDALDRSLLGARESGPPRNVGIVVPTTTPGSQELPEPRRPDENDGPPWPFLALSGLAGALVLTGAGSSIYRRTRR